MNNAKEWTRIKGGNLDELRCWGDGTVIIRYHNRIIEEIEITRHEDGIIPLVTIRYNDGRTISWRSPYFQSVFCYMYGVPLSFDCSHIFIQHYWGGLYCLSVQDGTVIWKSKSKALHKTILVNDNNTLCCAVGKRDIVLMEQETGIVLKKISVSYLNEFTVTAEDKILVEATKTEFRILDAKSLAVQEEILRSRFNASDGIEIWKRIFKDWRQDY